MWKILVHLMWVTATGVVVPSQGYPEFTEATFISKDYCEVSLEKYKGVLAAAGFTAEVDCDIGSSINTTPAIAPINYSRKYVIYTCGPSLASAPPTAASILTLPKSAQILETTTIMSDKS